MSLSILNHRNRKLDRHDLWLIKQLRAEGLSNVKIAEKFEISEGHVSRICNNRTWLGWQDEADR